MSDEHAAQGGSVADRPVPSELLGSIVRYFNPRRVILFGSRARGDADENSDIDLLVLLDAVDWPTERAIINLAGDIDPRLAPAIHAFDRYHAPPSRATGYYKEMRRESVRL